MRKPKDQSNNRLEDVVAASARRLETKRQIAPVVRGTPAESFRLTPGWVHIRVAMNRPDGTRVDVDGARALHADKPYASILQYRGMARSIICFEYDPKKLAELTAGVAKEPRHAGRGARGRRS